MTNMIEKETKGRVKYLNLAEPIPFECNYDFVISIEVAEHIPKIYEDIYVDNLIKCSKIGIVISWSGIGQSGHFHVNNKNKEEVILLFKKKGYKYQSLITERLKNFTTIAWVKSNLLYFAK